MIVEYYENPNKTAPAPVATLPAKYTGVSGYSETYYEKQALKKNVTVDEYKRRDAIVREHWKKCFFKRGDVVYPVKLTEYRKYGKCVVDVLVGAYSEMGDDESWPANDNPMLISAHVLEGTPYHFIATTNYFQTIAPLGAEKAE